jgi:hypothetical protein
VGEPFCPDHFTYHQLTPWEVRQIRAALIRAARLRTLVRVSADQGPREGFPADGPPPSLEIQVAAEKEQFKLLEQILKLKRSDDNYPRLCFRLVVTFAIMDWQELAQLWMRTVRAPRIYPDLSEGFLNAGTFDAYGKLDRVDGSKPHHAALIVSMNTADLALVMRFIGKRVRWYKRALKTAGVDPMKLASVAETIDPEDPS